MCPATVRKPVLAVFLLVQVLVAPCLPCPCRLIESDRPRAEGCALSQTPSDAASHDCCSVWAAAKNIRRLHNLNRADHRNACAACSLLPVNPSVSEPQRRDCAAPPETAVRPPDPARSPFLRE
jgi:hypothetical protein